MTYSLTSGAGTVNCTQLKVCLRFHLLEWSRRPQERATRAEKKEKEYACSVGRSWLAFTIESSYVKTVCKSSCQPTNMLDTQLEKAADDKQLLRTKSSMNSAPGSEVDASAAPKTIQAVFFSFCHRSEKTLSKSYVTCQEQRSWRFLRRFRNGCTSRAS